MDCYVKRTKLMGCSFELGVLENDSIKADSWLKSGISEILRIENLLSEFKSDSVTTMINNSSGKTTISAGNEVFNLIDRCIKISKLTKGNFDITVGPLKKLYQFKNSEYKFPEKKIINEALGRTGYQKIRLDKKKLSVYLTEQKMEISFAAIGKGYAADAVKKLWQRSGVSSGYINASGDLTTFGNHSDIKPWKVGIANPDNRNEILFYVPLFNSSVATSGDYEQHFWYRGKKYSHNIDPKTGLPLRGIKSISVFSPSAELSDALSTAVYSMGIRHGLTFVNQLPNTHCIMINEQNKIFFSKNLQYEEVS